MDILPSILVEMVRKLNGGQLHALNQEVIARLKLWHQAKDLNVLKEFNILDRVSFDYHGEKKLGTISRIHQKTVTVILDEGERWKISPHFLKKIPGEVNPLQDIVSKIAKK